MSVHMATGISSELLRSFESPVANAASLFPLIHTRKEGKIHEPWRVVVSLNDATSSIADRITANNRLRIRYPAAAGKLPYCTI